MNKPLITALLLSFAATTFTVTTNAAEMETEYEDRAAGNCEEILSQEASIEEREALKAECIEMESQYLSEQTEQTDCYAEVDTYIANNYEMDPNVGEQYESLLDACLARQSQD